MIKLKSGFEVTDFSSDALVMNFELNPDEGMFLISETAIFLWPFLEKGTTEEEMTIALCTEYDVQKNEARRDIQEFVEMLDKKEMLV